MRAKTILPLILILLVAAVAQAVDITITQVEVEDTTVSPSAPNRLSVERHKEIEVRVELDALKDLENVQVQAEITGYEHDVIQDTTPIFDAQANVSYVKKLRLLLPDDLESDDYKLRIDIRDRFSQGLTQEYNLRIDLPRNSITIESIDLNPASAVRSGSALIGSVRIRNSGERDQDNIRVTMNIPSLGVSDTKYIENIDSDDEEEETEEFFLRIPKCADPGVYDVIVEAEYNDRHKKISAKRTITVLEDSTCSRESESDKVTITLGQQVQSISQGETAIYPITITNPGKTSKTFVVVAQQNTWATVSMTPTSTVLVPAGQMHTLYVNVIANDDAPVGAHTVSVSINSGEQRNELSLTANISKAQTNVKQVFEVILVVLISLLVILGIIIGITRFRNGDDVEKYY